MSHFACPHCAAPCIDTPHGYVSGCEHFPPDAPQWAIEQHKAGARPHEICGESWLRDGTIECQCDTGEGRREGDDA